MITELRVQNFRSISDSGPLTLAPITVLVGRNNAGKSSLLRAIYQVQDGSPWSESDVRIGEKSLTMSIRCRDVQAVDGAGQVLPLADATLTLRRSGVQPPSISVKIAQNSNDLRISPFAAQEPQNLIYPSFSRRQALQYEEVVRKSLTTYVGPHDQNLISRISSISDTRTPHGNEFASLCRRVLDLDINMLTAENGQSLGTQVDRYNDIRIDSMGSGVLTVLSLLVNLCSNSGKIYLIEEPENDLHPAALKRLLDVISERCEHNQFIISTHSNIVVSRLGSRSDATVIEASSDGHALPTTTFKVARSDEERLAVLQNLGYELADVTLANGWLIFEESSAERICREYLIPWFVPELKDLRTVAAGGVSKVANLSEAFFNMFLFVHRNPAYKHNAWVIVDGDDAGLRALADLKHKFRSWPADHFVSWPVKNIESCFPSHFSNKVAEIDAAHHDIQYSLKGSLIKELCSWVEADTGQARVIFEGCFADLISTLRDIAVSRSV